MQSRYTRRPRPDARAIAAAIRWQYGDRPRRSLVLHDSPVARDPARDAARFLDGCLSELAREESRCRLMLGRLLAIFGRTHALIKLGFVGLSDYSRERLGISGSEADVTARVVKRLDGLPLLREAFVAGRISWTKARIISATADSATEAHWIEVAGRHAVRELEEIVAAEGAIEANAAADVREDDGVEVDGEPRARFRMRAPAWAWLFFRRVVELARTVAGEAGPVWKAVEAITAEAIGTGPDAFCDDDVVELAEAPSHAGFRVQPVGLVPADGDEAPRCLSTACFPGDPSLSDPSDLDTALPGVARWLDVDEASLRSLLPSAIEEQIENAERIDPIALDGRLRAVVRVMQGIDARIGRALRLFSERRLHRELGHLDLESYLKERLGIGLRKARSLITLDRVAGENAAMRSAYDAGALSWVRAIAILPVVSDGSGGAEQWVERARQVTVRRLVDEVAWALERKVMEHDAAALPPPLGARLEPVQMRVDGENAAADHVIEFTGPASVVSTLERLVVAWSEPAEPHWKGLVRLLAAVARQWQADGRRHRDRIVERDGYRCIAPGCRSRRNLEVHHLIFRSAGGGDEDWNLGTLCSRHHHHCLHRFHLIADGRAPDAIDWVFGAMGPNAPLMRLHGEVYADAPPALP